LGLRIYQCIGEAMFSPIGIAIVTVFLPATIKGRALGMMATMQGLGFCLGSLLGGYINTHLGWRGIFFVNIPIGILTILASIKMIPSKQPLSDRRSFILELTRPQTPARGKSLRISEKTGIDITVSPTRPVFTTRILFTRPKSTGLQAAARPPFLNRRQAL